VFVLEPVSAAVPTGEVQVPASTSAERTGPKQKTRATGNETPKQAAKAARVYAVTELPDGVRRELPTLVISGGTYSSNPTQRLIIVNNQVFTEGSQAVPGVVVERIEPSTAVLRFRGYAYRVGY
jgi:general secretion pathway protein B